MTITSLVCTDRLSDRIGAATAVELDKAFSWVVNSHFVEHWGDSRISVFMRFRACLKVEGNLNVEPFFGSGQVTHVTTKTLPMSHRSPASLLELYRWSASGEARGGIG